MLLLFAVVQDVRCCCQPLLLLLLLLIGAHMPSHVAKCAGIVVDIAVFEPETNAVAVAFPLSCTGVSVMDACAHLLARIHNLPSSDAMIIPVPL